MNTRWSHTQALLLLLTLAALAPRSAHAQVGFESLPGFESYQRVQSALGQFQATQRVRGVTWSEDGTSLFFRIGQQRRLVDLQTLTISEISDDHETQPQQRRPRRDDRRPARGAQRDRETSPDGRWTATSRDWNIWLLENETNIARRLTADGARKVRYGKASWVYGEELDQIDAMWWSPDSRFLAYYKFDERLVPDYPLLTDLTEQRPELALEGYPKPGDPNPIATLLIHDLQRDRTVEVQGTGRPDEYIYGVQFTPNGDDLLFHRLNRRQNRLELVAADPGSGRTRLLSVESQPTWQKARPEMRFLDDGRRYIWEHERSGWKQYELRSLNGRVSAALTRSGQPAERIVAIDESHDELYYFAWNAALPLIRELHRVALNGSSPMRLSEEGAHVTSAELSPDYRWMVITYETVADAPVTVLHRREGEVALTLHEAPTVELDQLDLPRPELMTFKSADGGMDLYAILYRPSGFDPTRSYPLLVHVYGGPLTRMVQSDFTGGRATCEFGFCIAVIDNRGTVERGKRFEAATYRNLGVADLDDQVAGVRAILDGRPYLDPNRVGIYGHSYGGYLAALAVLKYPEVFHAAVAGSAVTDWRNYDSIYTERFMDLPENNPQGYEASSCLTYAGNLRGGLLLQQGALDDNVHPTNAWQLANALQEAGRDFSMMIYPNSTHRLPSHANTALWRFLIENLNAVPGGTEIEGSEALSEERNRPQAAPAQREGSTRR